MRTSSRLFPMVALPLAALVVAGCSDSTGGDSGRVKAELVRLPGASTSATTSMVAAVSRVGSTTNPWTSQVNITSVRAPVVGIRLRGGDNGTFLYQCPAGTASGCLVELNGAALQDLLGTEPVSVAAGTYDVVDVLYCPEPFPSPALHRAQVTGTATIGGTTYYTRTAGSLSVAGPAEPLAIEFGGCSVNYKISPPLTVESGGGTTVVRLYFDILDIALAALPVPATSGMYIPSGCTPNSAPFLCVAYPDVIAVPGTTAPRIEHYRVNNGATVGLVFDASSDFWYGGYFRRYVVEDQLWNPGFTPDGSISSFTSNGSGSYRLEQHAYSSGEAGALFPSWQRATHTGTATVTGRSFTYSAVRLP